VKITRNQSNLRRVLLIGPPGKNVIISVVTAWCSESYYLFRCW